MSRRMFSSRIINSARFLQMSEGSQLLYFHLGMRADDDGIVEAWPIMKMLGTKPDDFKILCAKEFIAQLNAEQVIFIKDWKEHNTIRADRKINSVYFDLLKEAIPEGQLTFPKPRSDVKDNSGRVEPFAGGQSTDGISKVKLSKDNKHIAPAEPSPFVWPDYLSSMDDNPRKHVQLIAFFFKERGLRFDSRDEVSEAIARHSPAARRVLKFPEEKVTAAFDKAKDKYRDVDWTLETILKVLTN